MFLSNTTWLSAKSSKGCGNLMFSFNVFSFSFVVYLLEGQGSWTPFINTYCLKEIKIEMRRTLRLKKVRILLNNKYSCLVVISESVCVLENTLSLVLGY